MPEVNQIFFSHKEVVELLIGKAGFHEGEWMLSINFGFAPGNFGPTSEQTSPGVAVVVVGIGLVRAGPDTPDAVKVDASVVNPAPTKSRKKGQSASA